MNLSGFSAVVLVVVVLVVLTVFAGPSYSQSALLVVSEKSATRNGGLSALDRFSDEEVIHTVPGPSVLARKFLSVGTLCTMVGDEDFDDLVLETNVAEEFDALALRQGFSGNDPNLYDLVFSSQNDFGEAYGPPVEDSALWSFKRPPTPGGPVSPVEVFLSGAVLRAGLATSSAIDIDAVAIAADGALLLSLREDELIQGDAMLIGDGGIVGFPAATVVYGPNGGISSLGNNTAHIVLSEAAVDALVALAGLLDSLAAPIVVIDDLQGLEIDSSGGTFIGTDGFPWPHLLFCGSTTGPRILTTRGGIGSLNGSPLGKSSSPDASMFGLDGVSDAADFSSMAIVPSTDVPLVVDWNMAGFSPSFLKDTLQIGNATPGSVLLALFSIATTNAGQSFHSYSIRHYRFPGLYALPVLLVLPLGIADANGRVSLSVSFPAGIPYDVNLTLQVINSGIAELSAPNILTYDAEGL